MVFSKMVRELRIFTCTPFDCTRAGCAMREDWELLSKSRSCRFLLHLQRSSGIDVCSIQSHSPVLQVDPSILRCFLISYIMRICSEMGSWFLSMQFGQMLP